MKQDNLETRPFPNEHSCRLEDPGKYDRFARKNCEIKHDNKCIDVIFGIKSGKSEIQAMRYPKDIWDESAARNHCKSKGGSFEAAAKEVSSMADNNLFYRDFELDERAINVEDRAVDLSFSSEIPVPRWFGQEILSHADGAVDLKRAHSLLFSHNKEKIIGPISKKRIEDGIGRAHAGFDETEEGELALTRVKSKSLRGVSVGYMVYKYKKLEKDEEIELANGRKIKGTPEDNPTYVATKWAPIEISLTPIPADHTVGIGRELIRSLEGIEIEETVKSEIQTKGGNIKMAGERNFEQELVDALKNRDTEHQTRLKNILNRAKTLGLEGLAFGLVAEGKTDEEITDALFIEVAKQRGKPGDPGDGSNRVGLDIAKIDDDTIIRAIAEPVLINLS